AARRRSARLLRLLGVDPVQAKAHRRDARSRPRCAVGQDRTRYGRHPLVTAPHLFCFGFGYTALALARRLAAEGWIVGGTCRTADKASALRAAGFPVEFFDRDHRLLREALDGVTHLLVSVPPDSAGDPVLAVHTEDIAEIKGLRWLGYLSTTGVYGDRGGAWVDETAALSPSGERGRRRVAAEAGWLDLWRRHGAPVQIFRLAGGYGPGPSASRAMRER